MDQPTNTFARLLLLLAVTAIALENPSKCFAQADGTGVFDSTVAPGYSQGGSFFNRTLGTAFRFGYQSEGYGTEEGIVTLGSMKVWNMEGATLNFDAQATLSEEFGGGYNAGVFYRSLNDIGFGPDSTRIHGVGFWSDGQSTSADNFFSQLGVTLESLGDSYDLRFQGNFPLDRIKDSDPVLLAGAEPQFRDNFLMSDIFQFQRDTALTVVDFEGAKRVADLEAWAYLGGYHLSGSGFDATGYRAGVRGYAVPDLALSLQVTDDDIYHTNVMFGITWFVGRTSVANQPCGTLLDRFREPVQRNNFIATTQQTIQDAQNPFTDVVSGDPFFFVHVDSNAADGGDGTVENPFNDPNDVNNGSAPGNIILAHAGSDFTGEFQLQDDQRFLGQGLDPNGILIDHQINTNEEGLVTLPEASVGAFTMSAPTITALPGIADPNNATIVLADNNEVNNFTINGDVGGTSDTAILANGSTSPQLANLDINGPFVDGVIFNEVEGNALIENSVAIDGTTGRGMAITGGSGVVGANATVTNTAGRSVEVTDRTGGSVTVGILNDTGEGVLVADNSGGSTIDFSSLATINTTGANSAVTLRNNNGAAVTFQELQATSTDADTFSVLGGGTITVNDAQGDGSDIVNSGAGGALLVLGDPNGTGDPTVNIAGDIDNGGGGFVVDVRNMSGGSVSVLGNVSDPNNDGTGIRIQDNSDGVYSFSGTNTLATGASRSVELVDNGTSSIIFGSLNAASSSADETFLVAGGGTVTVSDDPNNPGVISNTGLGDAVVINSSADGNPNVTIDVDVQNFGGGLAANIQNLDGSTIDINGDVTDADTAGQGILVQANVNSTISFDGRTNLDTGINNSVTLSDNNTSTISFNSLVATSTSAANTFLIEGGGDITISDADPNIDGSITNAGAGAAFVVDGSVGGGDPNVVVDVDIVKTGAGLAVDIQNLNTGSVDINGAVTDTSTAGSGVLAFNNTNATINLDGATNLNTGTNTAVHLRNNTGSTLTFENLMATSAGSPQTFLIEGAGNVVVNDPNGNALIANTGTGSAFVVQGADDTEGDGDPTVLVSAEIQNEGGGQAVDIQDMTSGAVTITGNITDNDQNGMGILVQENSDASFVFGGDTTLDTGTNTAVTFRNNSGSTASFANLMATSGNSPQTFLVEGGGEITVANTGDTAFINNTGTGSALVVTGNNGAGTGDPNVSIAANITNTVGGRVVDIQDMAGGSVAVSGNVTDNDPNGTGINIQNNPNGTFEFTGETSISTTGANNAITIDNNNGSTVRFENVNATAEDGNTFEVTGGGTITVNDPNGTGLIENTGTGVALLVSGLGAGDPNVTINPDIVNIGGGLSVQIGSLTAEGVAINGTVTDTDGGIRVFNNSGGANIQFNELVTVNTTSATDEAIDLINNSGANISFNGLDLTSNSAEESFLATGGGNLTVLNTSGSSITQNGPGSALVLNGMTISAAGATFDTVDVTSGTSNSIDLTNIDGTGLLTIGSGTDPNDGGRITTSGTAIDVSNVDNLAVSNIRIDNTTGNGVRVINQAAGSSATFAGMDINTTTGTGFNVTTNSGGTIALNDSTVDSTDGNAVINTNNTGATVNYSELAATSVDGNTFTIQGGGAINVNDGAAGSTITNTGIGDALVVEGAGAGGVVGNPTATIEANIDNSGPGLATRITDLTGGTVTISGDVTDTDPNVAGGGILVADSTAGTVTYSGNVTLDTGINDAVTIQNNGAANTVTFDAASVLDIDTTTGRGIVADNAGTVNVLGTGNTIDTTSGTAIDILDSDAVTINNTVVNMTDPNTNDAMTVSHTSSDDSSVTFNDVNVASSGGTGLFVDPNGTGEFSLVANNLTMNLGNEKGILIDTGTNANRVNFTLNGGDITVADENALQAVLDESNTADVRFLLVDNELLNNSGTAGNDAATVDIAVTSDLTLNATVGNGPNDPNASLVLPIGDQNRFVNSSADGDAFLASINSAGGTLNLDLRDNTAQSGDVQFGLTQTSGTFDLVDSTDTLNDLNNIGTTSDAGVIGDILPPLLQP